MGDISVTKLVAKSVELFTHLAVYAFYLALNYVLKAPLKSMGITPFLCNCLRFCIGERATYNVNKGGDPYI